MLTSFQQEVLRAIAANRTPASHIAGGAALNRDLPRLTGDIDIFHDVAEAVRASAGADARVLLAAGYSVEEDPALRHLASPVFIERIVALGANATRLQWAADSAVRFLPPVRDPLFGYRLSDPDLAVNKALALAGRAAARDVVDIVALHGGGFPLMALAWAAPGKDPGFSAPLLLEWITRNACQITAADWRTVASTAPVDPVATKAALLEAVDEARSTLRDLPPGPQGRLFMGADGTALRPVPDLVRGDVPSGVTVLDCKVGPALAQMAPGPRGR
jgi:hypothetical protein